MVAPKPPVEQIIERGGSGAGLLQQQPQQQQQTTSRTLRSRLPSVGLGSSTGDHGKSSSNSANNNNNNSIVSGSNHPGSSGNPLHPAIVQDKQRDPESLLEGWLKKRGMRIQSHWSERYFALKGDQLLYYLKPTDPEPRGAYILDRTCVISEVKPYSTSYDKKKILYAFRVLWPEGVEVTEHYVGEGEKEEKASEGGANSIKNINVSTRNTNVSNIEKRHSQSVDSRSWADVAPDPYVQSPYVPPSISIKIIRSAYYYGQQSSMQRGDSLRRSGGRTSGTGNSGTSTLAAGGAMVAMAVGGVVVGAVTAGLGLVAPMVIAGVTAAAGSGATVYGASQHHSGGVKTKQISLVLALENKEHAEEWRSAIEAQIRWSQGFPSQSSRWMTMVGLDRRMPRSILNRVLPISSATKLGDVDRWTRCARWRPWRLYHGVRIYELEEPALAASSKSSSKLMLPCRKIQATVRGTPLETFVALVSIPCRVLNGIVDSLRILERIDDHSDVIHLTLKPLFFWPTWTAARDFVLVRYWRYDEDGTYIICFDSTTHRDSPRPAPGIVRGDFHAVYTISPKKHLRHVDFDEASECLLTYIVQVNPRGWIWNSFGYLDAFVAEMLLHVLDVRDLLETERFMAVHIDTSEENQGGMAKEVEASPSTSPSTVETHRPTVPVEMWAEVDAATFVVRGPDYSNSKLKVPSEKAAFRLLAVDLFDLPEAKDNIASHPNNRIQAAIKKGDCPPFIWVVQLQIPGTDRQLGYVSYFAPDDMSIFDEDTPLARVIKPFFFGDDDNYRDNRFKLIPKIVEGNWVVRKSVGSTPAILGTKLKQNYYRGSHYFELDVNIASSSVAAGVVRLAAGYAKTLVVDLALVIQGEEEEELPERVVACWRIKFMDLSIAKPLE